MRLVSITFLVLAFTFFSYPQVNDSLLQFIWQINFDDELGSELTAGENRFYVQLKNGTINCLELNGKTKWNAEVIGNIERKSVLFKDVLLTATNQGDLYSFNSNNGEVLQVVGIGEEITSDLCLIDIKNQDFISKAVVVGTAAGNLFCYDIFSFELIWSVNISKLPLTCCMFFKNDKIFLSDNSNTFYCINSKTGSLIWKYAQTPNQNYLTLKLFDDKFIYSLSPKSELIAIDQMIGKKLWSTISLKSIMDMFFTDNQKNILLIDEKGAGIIVSVKDGKEIIKFDLKKTGITSVKSCEIGTNKLLGFSDGSIILTNDYKRFIELKSADNIGIKTLSFNNNYLLIANSNGKITAYKFFY